jgi:Mg-chelatase subunit ChlD
VAIGIWPRAVAAEPTRARANGEDEFFLVAFNDLPRLAAPLTRRTEEIQNRLATARRKGRTALFDAAVRALQEIKKSKPHRKTLLIIPDGGDNSSCFAETEFHSRIWLRRATY